MLAGQSRHGEKADRRACANWLLEHLDHVPEARPRSQRRPASARGARCRTGAPSPAPAPSRRHRPPSLKPTVNVFTCELRSAISAVTGRRVDAAAEHHADRPIAHHLAVDGSRADDRGRRRQRRRTKVRARARRWRRQYRSRVATTIASRSARSPARASRPLRAASGERGVNRKVRCWSSAAQIELAAGTAGSSSSPLISDAKRSRRPAPVEVERLHAQVVAREQQRPRWRRPTAPRQRFRLAAAKRPAPSSSYRCGSTAPSVAEAKRWPRASELGAQLLVVVDLAVEQDVTLSRSRCAAAARRRRCRQSPAGTCRARSRLRPRSSSPSGPRCVIAPTIRPTVSIDAAAPGVRMPAIPHTTSLPSSTKPRRLPRVSRKAPAPGRRRRRHLAASTAHGHCSERPSAGTR